MKKNSTNENDVKLEWNVTEEWGKACSIRKK